MSIKLRLLAEPILPPRPPYRFSHSYIFFHRRGLPPPLSCKFSHQYFFKIFNVPPPWTGSSAIEILRSILAGDLVIPTKTCWWFCDSSCNWNPKFLVSLMVRFTRGTIKKLNQRGDKSFVDWGQNCPVITIKKCWLFCDLKMVWWFT